MCIYDTSLKLIIREVCYSHISLLFPLFTYYYSESLFLDVAKQNSLFFLSGFSFTNICDSQDSSGKWEAISLYPFCHFHSLHQGYLQLPWLHRHVDISRVIAAETSPLSEAGSRTRTGNFWFPNVSH